jgi:hypothetical protein
MPFSVHKKAPPDYLSRGETSLLPNNAYILGITLIYAQYYNLKEVIPR